MFYICKHISVLHIYGPLSIPCSHSVCLYECVHSCTYCFTMTAIQDTVCMYACMYEHVYRYIVTYIIHSTSIQTHVFRQTV